ncbi:unnamed protein product [Blepharisma stoltei]|uniref:Uncharacterized protein n=1 Tax=Blepharisma stoltei TaxID=1481888 RepID=A0AAU9IS11_9CILI|nr:unnamed protein product [Blepharisma stoltei]
MNQQKNNRLRKSYSPKASLNSAKREKSVSKPIKSLQNENNDDKFSPKSIDYKIASFSTTVSQSISATDLRFPTLSSPKLSQKTLQSYLAEVKKSLPEDISTQPSERVFTKPKVIKRKPGTRKSTRKGTLSLENSMELRKWKKSAKIKKSKTPGKGLGELMQLMYKKPIKGPPNNDSTKELTSRLYDTAQNEPEEVFRIISSPKKSLDKLIAKKQEKKFEWTEEHEQAFRSLLRKTHSFNSMTKTRLFRELEKKLPEKKTKLEKDWKYDKRSPYINDLDYQSKDYYASGLDLSSPSSHKIGPISNIKTTIRDESFEIDLEEKRIQELVEKTGLSPTNITKLEKIGTHIEKIKDFEDAMKGFEMIYNWEESEAFFDKAKGFLASHILSELHVDMKDLNKARYSYLSGKIAYQRATAELHKKLMLRAEEKRIELRKRQEEFQREVFKTKVMLKKMYGISYINKPKKYLKTTSYKMGSPEFNMYMIKLGYLPPKFKAAPEKLKKGGIIYYKTSSKIPEKSVNNMSQWNYPPDFKAREIEAANKKLMSIKAAAKIQSRIKGWLMRRRMRRMKKASLKIQKLWRAYKCRKVLIAKVITQLFNGNKAKVAKLAKRFKESSLYYKLYQAAEAKRKSKPPAAILSSPKTQKIVPSITSLSSDLSSSHTEKDLSPKRALHSPVDPPKHVTISEPPINNSINPSDQARESYRLEVEAQRINNLLKEILSTRKEMWKYYLGRVNHSELNDQNLTRLLSHESVYAKEQTAGKRKGIIWEESVIRLGAGDDVIQHATPDSLRGKPTDIIIANLSKELCQAIIAKDQARVKFYSLQNKIEDFYKKVNPDPVCDDPFLRKCLTIKEIPDKEEIPLLKPRKSFNPIFGAAESMVGNMVREASSISFRVVG